MPADSEFGIVLDPDALSEDYVATIISARERNIKELQRCVSPAIMGQKPLSSWLYGKPGTGKTTVACHVLSELNRRNSLPGIYVNCWKHNTFFSVLEYMLDEMKIGFGDARDTSVKLSQFERMIKDRPFLIILDEIDIVHLGERNDIIYNLFSTGKVGLMCISESRYPVLQLEARIKSRLSPRLVAFRPYSINELVDILRQRAVRALHPDSWSTRTLELIARKAGGDARIAIHTLRNAAVYADAESANKIQPAHIREGFSDTEDLRTSYDLKRLTQHHTLLYRIIMDRPGITSTELLSAYRKECKSKNWKPVAERTFSLYMKTMTELKLLKAERARVKGRVHAYSVMDHSG